MNRLIFAIPAVLFFACASPSANDRGAQDLAGNLPEFLDLDLQIQELESDTQKVLKRYQEVQDAVLEKADFADRDETPESLAVYVNENNVLIVNGKPMSRNEFSAFADENLPALCSPRPKISAHPKADYDNASAALELIYAHGCHDIDIE